MLDSIERHEVRMQVDSLLTERYRNTCLTKDREKNIYIGIHVIGESHNILFLIIQLQLFVIQCSFSRI